MASKLLGATRIRNLRWWADIKWLGVTASSWKGGLCLNFVMHRKCSLVGSLWRTEPLPWSSQCDFYPATCMIRLFNHSHSPVYKRERLGLIFPANVPGEVWSVWRKARVLYMHHFFLIWRRYLTQSDWKYWLVKQKTAGISIMYLNVVGQNSNDYKVNYYRWK